MDVRPLVAGLLLYAAWEYYRAERGDADAGGVVIDTGRDLTQGIISAAGALWDSIEGGLGFMNIGAMAGIDPAVLNSANLRAFLRVIRAGEGTTDDAGYRRLYGGQLFSGYADHPRIKVTAGKYTSTAAGAYQFLSSTWDETRRVMGLTDFSPASQDMAAVGRIAARGALADVLAGRLGSALRKCAWEWASLPGSPYGQPVISWEKAAAVYASAGGDSVQMVA